MPDGSATASVGNVVGPGTDSVSLSLIKSIKITERLQFQFGAQAANALNHRNYDVPNQFRGSVRVRDDFRVADGGRSGSAERGDHRADQLLKRGSGKGEAGAASPFSVLRQSGAPSGPRKASIDPLVADLYGLTGLLTSRMGSERISLGAKAQDDYIAFSPGIIRPDIQVYQLVRSLGSRP